MTLGAHLPGQSHRGRQHRAVAQRAGQRRSPVDAHVLERCGRNAGTHSGDDYFHPHQPQRIEPAGEVGDGDDLGAKAQRGDERPRVAAVQSAGLGRREQIHSDPRQPQRHDDRQAGALTDHHERYDWREH